MASLNGLTDKQKVFVTEYLKCWNGAEAARRAGYAFPRQSASENLSNPNIRRVVEAELSLKAMEKDELLWRLGEKARFDISRYLLETDDGERYPAIDIDKLMADGKGHLLRKMYPTQSGTRIEFADPDEAQQLIGKHLGLFTDKLDLSGEVKHRIEPDFSGWDESELTDFIRLLKRAVADSEGGAGETEPD